MEWNDNKLTDEIKSKLKQGTKVRFKWYGNSELEYVGRIELDKWGNNIHYWIPEHCFKDDILIYEDMRYYNQLDSFHYFTMFEIIEE